MANNEDLRYLHGDVSAAKAAYMTAQDEVSRLLKRPESLEALRIAHQVLHEAMEQYRQFIEARN